MFDKIVQQIIIQKLKLFSGNRTVSQDNALLENASNHLAIETIKFIEENTQHPIQGLDSKTTQEILTTRVTQLLLIPNWKQQLIARLNYQLDNLVINGF